MLADTDVGNVAVAAQAGAHWGFRLLPLLLALIPALYIIQELTVRLGIFTRKGLSELIHERFGRTWSVLAGIGLAVVVLASLVTEFTGVAGVGELYGVSRNLSVSLAGAVLLAIVTTGTYRRIEFITLWIGLFQLAFFAVAATAHPSMHRVAHEMIDIPFGNGAFWLLVAAIIGACFNPWMMFYQQSAVVDKRLGQDQYTVSRIETAVGAVITQLLTAAVLLAAATSFGPHGFDGSLKTVGDISRAMKPLLGPLLGPLVFSVGVLGASMVAAVVCSLALAWGIGELCGMRRMLEHEPKRLRWFFLIYAAGVIAAGALVLFSPNLLWLAILAQVANVFMLPLVVGFLIALAATCLPDRFRLRGRYLWLTVGLAIVTCGCGLFGGIRGIENFRRQGHNGGISRRVESFAVSTPHCA
jgi:Mn2+/Fe2+ NRAMP family transporter